MKDRIKALGQGLVKPAATVGSGIAASGMVNADTFSFAGMEKLDNVTGDFATLLSGNFIDLIIALAIVGLISGFVYVFKKALNKAT